MRWLWRLKSQLTPRMLRGQRAERLACEYLRAQGYVIRERNVRFPVGEIDLIAQDGGVLCFVEVRSTSSQQWGGSLGSITDRKRRRVVHAARWYLRYHPPAVEETRFDVVAIDWREGSSPRVELVRGAFMGDER